MNGERRGDDAIPARGPPAPPLTIVGAVPASGVGDAPPDVGMVAAFSNQLDEGALTRNTMQLVREGTTVPVAATLSYDLPSGALVLTPAAPLEPGAGYVVTVEGGP